MTKEKILSSFIVALSFVVSGVIVTYAQTPDGVKFPVTELGGCKDESACREFCENKDNVVACVNFAEKNGMITAEEASQAKKYAAMGDGPGGCKDQTTCSTYCEDTANLDSCLSFAEKNGMIGGEELEQAKKVAKALKEGADLPGGCKNKADCDNYCGVSTHMEECLNFAEKAGFLSGDELKEAKKFAPLVARGETPGKCTSKDSCENYCKDEANIDECFSFAEKNGLVSKEEAEMYRKTGGKGPGNCRSKESCDSYCNNPANAETCFKFAEEKGLIPPEKLKEAKEGMAKMQQGLKMATPEVMNCLKENLGEENFSRVEAGTFIPGPSAGEAIRNCFASMQKYAEEKMSQIPDEARPCITSKLGEDAFDKMKKGEVPPNQIEETIQSCMKESIKGKIQSEIMQNIKGNAPEGVDPSAFSGEAEGCMKELYGDDYESTFGKDTDAKEVQSAVSNCMQSKIKSKVMEEVKKQMPKNLPKGVDASQFENRTKPPTAEEIEDIKKQYGAPTSDQTSKRGPSPEEIEKMKSAGFDKEDNKVGGWPVGAPIDDSSYGPPANMPAGY